MNKLNRRDFLKILAVGTIFPEEVISSINHTKQNIIEILSFNTQRKEISIEFKESFNRIIKLLSREGNDFIIGLQEVSNEFYLFLKQLIKENGLQIERGGELNENISIFSGNITIDNSVNQIIGKKYGFKGRKILKTQISKDGETIIMLNGDLSFGISEKSRKSRKLELNDLLMILKNYKKAIITLDTNFLLEREKNNFNRQLKQERINSTKLPYTYEVSRLEESDLYHMFAKMILEYTPLFNRELDKIIIKGFDISYQNILDDIKVSDHYPVITKLI